MLNIVLAFVRPQIDSQVPDATFQTVLFPVPPPKSLAAENGESSQSFSPNGRMFRCHAPLRNLYFHSFLITSTSIVSWFLSFVSVVSSIVFSTNHKTYYERCLAPQVHCTKWLDRKSVV